MPDIYEHCPTLENDFCQLRLLRAEDAAALLPIYSDKAALPYFNSDNCHGDIFYYATPARMAEAVQYWLDAYTRREFVRWTILEKATDKVIGTVEGFRRGADGHFGDVALLRVDVGSADERADVLERVFSLVMPASYTWFDSDEVITKCPPYAVERIAALQRCGFTAAACSLVAGEGRTYGDYWTVRRGGTA